MMFDDHHAHSLNLRGSLCPQSIAKQPDTEFRSTLPEEYTRILGSFAQVNSLPSTRQ